MKLIYGKKVVQKNTSTPTLDLSSLTGKSDDFIITENNIYLNGEINPDSAHEITTYIIEANFPPENLPPLTHINLFINSLGGCMESTFAMISAVRASKVPVRTIALGSCASGGLMLAISGHHRLIDEYCSVMSHTLSTGFPDFAKHEGLENWLQGVKVETEKIVSLYHTHIKMDKAEIRSKLLPSNKDVYLTAEQAIGYGMFDGYFTSLEDLT